mmetsp:Transcript_38329/g.114762  ORF Transcript_38329/g.114762 Transcript_38329/m.114762 type:complete len:246 (-) Transcript_38329:172-909(-)
MAAGRRRLELRRSGCVPGRVRRRRRPAASAAPAPVVVVARGPPRHRNFGRAKSSVRHSRRLSWSAPAHAPAPGRRGRTPDAVAHFDRLAAKKAPRSPLDSRRRPAVLAVLAVVALRSCSRPTGRRTITSGRRPPSATSSPSRRRSRVVVVALFSFLVLAATILFPMSRRLRRRRSLVRLVLRSRLRSFVPSPRSRPCGGPPPSPPPPRRSRPCRGRAPLLPRSNKISNNLNHGLPAASRHPGPSY